MRMVRTGGVWGNGAMTRRISRIPKATLASIDDDLAEPQRPPPLAANLIVHGTSGRLVADPVGIDLDAVKAGKADLTVLLSHGDGKEPAGWRDLWRAGDSVSGIVGLLARLAEEYGEAR
jgi:hypothetical protein